jgi:perosamine synthetase
MSRLAINGGTPAVPDQSVIKHWPIITEDDKRAVIEPLEEDALLWGPYGKQVMALQDEWARYVGVKHCLATNSGTAALHLAVMAAGIMPGDEVITSAFTFVASATCVLHHNGVPVFADIDQETMSIDAADLERRITPKTKAIIPVHIFGMPANMDEINAVARKHNLIVIEDACQSHGATYKGKKTGALSDIGCFSLNGYKHLPGGEGGLLVTDSDDFVVAAGQGRMFGEKIDPGKQREYKAYTIGWMYRTTELTAAFTRSQLKRMDAYNALRNKNAAYLTSKLADIPGLHVIVAPPDRTSANFFFTFKVRASELGLDVPQAKFRDAVMKALLAEGVPAQAFQVPTFMQPVFQVREGYGYGCPWTCPYGNAKDLRYDLNDYPNVKQFCDEYILLRHADSRKFSCINPPNNESVMQLFVDGIQKVFANIDAVVDLARQG